MDHEFVLVKVFRKLCSGYKMELRCESKMFFDPIGYFYRTDIFTLAMVRAAFCNQDLVMLPDRINCSSAGNSKRKVAFVPRH